MRELVGILALAALATSARAQPDELPSCRFKKLPAILCTQPKNAAEAWNQVGFNLRAATDSNNRQLLAESGCAVVGDAEFLKVRVNHNMGPGKLATSKGWVTLALVTVPNYTGAMWIATEYLHQGCKTQWPPMPDKGWPTLRPYVM